MLFPCLPLFQFAKFIFNFFDFFFFSLAFFLSSRQVNLPPPAASWRHRGFAPISFNGAEVQPGGRDLQGKWHLSEQDAPGKAAEPPIKYIFMLPRRSLLSAWSWQGHTDSARLAVVTASQTIPLTRTKHLALVLAPTQNLGAQRGGRSCSNRLISSCSLEAVKKSTFVTNRRLSIMVVLGWN